MRGRGARRLARAGRVGALEIVATRTAPEPLTFGSTAAVSMSSPADPDPADNTASVTTTYVPTGDLRLTLDGTAGPLNEGESLVWTFTLGNLGPNETARVALAQSLPSGFALGTVATTHGLCTPSPASLDCALGTLAPGTTVTVVVSGAPPRARSGRRSRRPRPRRARPPTRRRPTTPPRPR